MHCVAYALDEEAGAGSAPASIYAGKTPPPCSGTPADVPHSISRHGEIVHQGILLIKFQKDFGACFQADHFCACGFFHVVKAHLAAVQLDHDLLIQ